MIEANYSQVNSRRFVKNKKGYIMIYNTASFGSWLISVYCLCHSPGKRLYLFREGLTLSPQI